MTALLLLAFLIALVVHFRDAVLAHWLDIVLRDSERYRRWRGGIWVQERVEPEPLTGWDMQSDGPRNEWRRLP